MPFNGTGTFVREYNWEQDKANGIKVRADRMDGEDNGFATGLSTCVTKDGQTTTTAVVPFAFGIATDSIAEESADTGVTIDGVLLKDSEVSTDTINELTPDAGVTVDGVLLKDGDITATDVDATTITATTFDGDNFSILPSGTKLLFPQASAPTGWTQDNTVNDRVLRLVDNTGTGGATGGSWTISGLTNGVTGSTTLTTAQIPSHTHTTAAYANPGYGLSGNPSALVAASGSTTTGAEGGGGSHNHSGSTISADGNWRPAYLNSIIATKD